MTQSFDGNITIRPRNQTIDRKIRMDRIIKEDIEKRRNGKRWTVECQRQVSMEEVHSCRPNHQLVL